MTHECSSRSNIIVILETRGYFPTARRPRAEGVREVIPREYRQQRERKYPLVPKETQDADIKSVQRFTEGKSDLIC